MVKGFVLMFAAMIITMFCLDSMTVFAQTVTINPDTTFLTQVLQFIQQFGGLGWMAKVSTICLLIVAASKTSFIAPLWAKLPAIVQTLSAPILALIGGIISQGTTLTWASALAYVGAGAGAVILHEVLDGLKTVPGIGAAYVSIINLIEGFLGGGSSAPAITK